MEWSSHDFYPRNLHIRYGPHLILELVGAWMSMYGLEVLVRGFFSRIWKIPGADGV